MRKLLVVLLGTVVVAVLLLAPMADAGPRKLCYADAHGAVFARNTSCAVAEAVVEVVAKRYDFTLKPFRIRRVYGNWRCEPYLHGEYHDVICRSRGRAVGVGFK
jgi:hypothetical protein